VEDVISSLPEGRQGDPEFVQTVIDILAEPASAHLSVEGDIGGGDDPREHLDRALAAERLDLSLLQRAQQLRLRRERKVDALMCSERVVERASPVSGRPSIARSLVLTKRAGERFTAEGVVGVTPVSKKHSPPNDRPISSTLCVASRKASVTAGLLPFWPFQSDHSAGLDMLTMILPDSFPEVSGRFTGLDHQNWV